MIFFLIVGLEISNQNKSVFGEEASIVSRFNAKMWVCRHCCHDICGRFDEEDDHSPGIKRGIDF